VPEGHEARPRPCFDEAESPEWFRYVGPPLAWQCQASRQIENFCDVGHFSVLHTDTFGNPDAIAMEPYEVDRSGEPWMLRFGYRYCGRDPTAPIGPDGDQAIVPIDFAYRIDLPFAVWLGGAHGPGSALMVATAPVTATSCKLFWVSTFHTKGAVDTDQLLAIEEKIWERDRVIVESQRPVRLFTDHPTVNMPFDRLSVAYRRALTALGFCPEAGVSA
jgi:vanillate O-demethylase monooxygenase subunit